MTYVDVPDPFLDVDKSIRSTDIKQLRDNIRDHESRLLFAEDPNNLFTHFNDKHRYASDIVLTDTSAAIVALNLYDADRFTLRVLDATWTENVTTTSHYLQCASAGGGLHAGAIEAVPMVYFDGMTKPITLTTRLKFSNMTRDFIFVGFHDGSMDTTRPTNGIYLEYVSNTNWRFTASRGGSNTVGTSFAHGLSGGDWFEVQIVWTDDAGDHAECYIDSDLKEDITGANLPHDKSIQANSSIGFSAGENFQMDRIALSSSGLDDSA